MGSFKNADGNGAEKTRGKRNSFKRYWKLFFRKFWTFFKINLVYFLFCIPVITFGPATAALTAMMRNIYLERPQFIFSDFKDLIKENFKKSFMIGIVDIIMMELAVFLFVFWDLFIGEEYRSVQMTLIAADALFLLLNFYIYPQIAAMDLPMSAIVKNSVILMFVNFGGELIPLALFAGYAMLLRAFTIYVAPLLPFVPLAWLGYTAVFCCYPTIQKQLIDPYYERTGEKNPEAFDPEEEDEDVLFKDSSENEPPENAMNATRGNSLFKGSGQNKRRINSAKETRGKKVIK